MTGIHIATVGWDLQIVSQIGNPVRDCSSHRFSNFLHPRLVAEDWPDLHSTTGMYFFRERWDQPLPKADRQFLASLEGDGIPSVHNMILGDRVVSKLPYDDALRYATFLSRRLIEMIDSSRPDVVITGFDSIHASLGLAVARHLDLPVFALHFSVIPRGMACFCSKMTPDSRVNIGRRRSEEMSELAKESLSGFESRRIVAPAYVAPRPASIWRGVSGLPAKVASAVHVLRREKSRDAIRFTESRTKYSVGHALVHVVGNAISRRAIYRFKMHERAPDGRFILFGFHMQPESSIDVWAPFFSNQKWVVELLSRSIPPTHKLLVKIHKSDTSSYSRKDLQRMQELPGVELVAPIADSRDFVEKAEMIVAIQGTLGLEGALMRKPVIMLGESPLSVFPNVELAGALHDLPSLVRAKLESAPPGRDEILTAYAKFLAPFYPASHNDWKSERTEADITGFVRMFDELAQFLEQDLAVQSQQVSG